MLALYHNYHLSFVYVYDEDFASLLVVVVMVAEREGWGGADLAVLISFFALAASICFPVTLSGCKAFNA